MKRIASLLLVLLLCSQLFAQNSGNTEITGESKTTLIRSIEKAHKQLFALQAQFTQEKSSSMLTEKIVQKGKLYYRAPKQLRWEYTSPQAMAIIFSNDKVLLKTNKGTTSNPNKALNEMGNLIISTINGHFLTDNTNFSTRYYKNGKTGKNIVVLTPLNKRFKSVYTKMTITIDSQNKLAEKITLHETSGDVTTITFFHPQLNLSLSDSLFK